MLFEGGMQDYNYFLSNCFELTIEAGNCKYPMRDDLNAYWDMNRDSMLHYIQQADIGLSGSILDALSGKPIAQAVLKVDEIDHDVESVSDGSYWRLLMPGLYHVTVSKQG